MSYVDPHRSGTTFGVLEFNEIFAPNARDWSVIVSDLDTVICKVPFNDSLGNPLNAYHLLTVYLDGAGIHHWYGEGIYLCCNVSGSTIQMGDAVCMSTTAATSGTNSRPVVEIGTTSTDIDYPFGIVLEEIADQGYGCVAMAGAWPVKRGSNTLTFRSHVIIDSNPVGNQGKVATTTSGQKGCMGKTLATDYPIIINSGGTTEDGGVVLLWGTSKELF